MAKKTEEVSISTLLVKTGRMHVYILSKTPLVYNAMSAKVKGELLAPKPKNNRKIDILTRGPKHDPLQEYRDSFYRHMENNKPTRLMFPAGAFKSAIKDAAKDLPGVSKAEVGRLLWIEDRDIDIYGVPQMYMATVRQAGMNRTPDIRTRSILPEWACKFAVSYVEPVLTAEAVSHLIAAGGLLIGIGDGRQGKGYFNYGQFEVVEADDPRWQAIAKAGGRDKQDAAIRVPQPFDAETTTLFSLYNERVAGASAAQPEPKAKRSRSKPNGTQEDRPEAQQ